MYLINWISLCIAFYSMQTFKYALSLFNEIKKNLRINSFFFKIFKLKR